MAITTDIERFVAMGTRVELHRFGTGDGDALARARRAIEAVDDALTIHRPSVTTALNECLMTGQSAPVDDPILFEALVAIEAAHASTFGLFDPAADRRMPGSGWGAILFDSKAARIEASQPVALDFGGFGKGFALDRARAVLRRCGVRSACMSAGESSIAVVGEHPLGGGWPFAIPHPLQTDRVLVEVELEDEALSISATVGAGTNAPDRAAMLRPGDGSVVTAPRCTVAIDPSGAGTEIISTALLVADHERALRLLNGGRRFVFDLSFEPAVAGPLSRMHA